MHFNARKQLGVISAPRRLKQRDGEFKAMLDYIETLSQIAKNK
jgi:hypothetical protein